MKKQKNMRKQRTPTHGVFVLLGGDHARARTFLMVVLPILCSFHICELDVFYILSVFWTVSYPFFFFLTCIM